MGHCIHPYHLNGAGHHQAALACQLSSLGKPSGSIPVSWPVCTSNWSRARYEDPIAPEGQHCVGHDTARLDNCEVNGIEGGPEKSTSQAKGIGAHFCQTGNQWFIIRGWLWLFKWPSLLFITSRDCALNCDKQIVFLECSTVPMLACKKSIFPEERKHVFFRFIFCHTCNMSTSLNEESFYKCPPSHRG